MASVRTGRTGGARGDGAKSRARSKFRSTGEEGPRRSLWREAKERLKKDGSQRRKPPRFIGRGEFRVHPDEVVGQGAWSVVCQAVDVRTNRLCVAKVVRKEHLRDEAGQNEVLREVAVLRHLPRHRHIVEFVELVDEGEEYCLILEAVSGGDLCDAILDSPEGKVAEDLARRYFRQVVEALICCHRNGVTHRDCKPENVLMSDRQELKLTDFGLARIYPQPWRCRPQDQPCDLVGTLRYAAPEVFQGHFEGKRYDPFISDVWSLGVCLYVMLTGAFPFSVGQEVDEERTRDALYNSEHEPPDDCSPEACALLDRLLEKDPCRRIDLQEVLAHEWLGGGEILRTREAETAECGQHILQLESELVALEEQLSKARAQAEELEDALQAPTPEEMLEGESGLRAEVAALRRRNVELKEQADRMSDRSSTHSPVSPSHGRGTYGRRGSGSIAGSQSAASRRAASPSQPRRVFGTRPETGSPLRHVTQETNGGRGLPGRTQPTPVAPRDRSGEGLGIGDLVLYTDRVTEGQCEARVRFVGQIESGQEMVGIEIVRSVKGLIEGRHDGCPRSEGRRYFTCPAGRGLLVAPGRCSLLPE
eukprot:Hpha_TRINITY_DN18918_c0_g1::TRINITY_DN18918_c0_g1_i1::g.17398::m.17398/K08802/SNRK; SNF related kinase